MRDPGDSFPSRIHGLCDEPTCCGAIPEGRRSRRDGKARFCSDACRTRYRNRAIARGYRLYEVATRWRSAPRSHQRGAVNPPTGFADVTDIIDKYLREDRELRDRALVARGVGDASQGAGPG